MQINWVQGIKSRPFPRERLESSVQSLLFAKDGESTEDSKNHTPPPPQPKYPTNSQAAIPTNRRITHSMRLYKPCAIMYKTNAQKIKPTSRMLTTKLYLLYSASSHTVSHLAKQGKHDNNNNNNKPLGH